MKKSLFIALFLVLSSFFFISVKEVEAYEYSFDVDFSLINDKFFLFKEKVDQFVKEDDMVIMGNREEDHIQAIVSI